MSGVEPVNALIWGKGYKPSRCPAATCGYILYCLTHFLTALSDTPKSFPI